jgi:hypothetical protein
MVRNYDPKMHVEKKGEISLFCVAETFNIPGALIQNILPI